MRRRFVGILRALPFLTLSALALAFGPSVPSISAQSGTLSLVYLDAEKPGSLEVWVTSLDGAEKWQAVTLAPGANPLDLRGHRLAVVSGSELILLDLADGDIRRIAAPRVTSAYITEHGDVFFATRAGCGPGTTKAAIGRIDAATGAHSDIAELEEPGAEILWHSAATNEIVVTPRGCDPGVWAIRRHDAQTGAQKSSLDVEGCGWAAVSPNGTQALITTVVCGLENAPALSVYDLQGTGRREFRLDKDGLSQHPVVYAPDGKRIAYGVAAGSDTRAGLTAPGSGKSGGIWLLDAASLSTSKLWQDEGLESWAIDWSPDGSKLLVASVEAQGRCRYVVVEVASGEAKPVEGVNGCGPNGTLVGFATLP